MVPIYDGSVRSRILYIEPESEGLNGPARIGRVTFSKTGATLSHRGRLLQRLRLLARAAR